MSERQLPDPLVPAEVDLRGYEFMPFYGDRCFGSESWIAASAEARVAMLRLWWRSYAHEVPASSLPSNDALLAEYAGYGVAPRQWAKVRAQVLRGYVECSDGRLYHKAIAPLAIDAWEFRNKQRDRTEAARQARLSRRQSQNKTTRAEPSVTESTGQDRTGQDRGTTAAAPPPGGSDPIFGTYLAWMQAKGMHPGSARNFLATIRHGYGDELVLEVLADGQREDVSKPLSWVKKALETRFVGRRKHGAGNRQEALEERNRKAVQDWQPPEVRDAAE